MLQRAAVGRDEVLALDAHQRLGRRRRGEAEDQQEGEQEAHQAGLYPLSRSLRGDNFICRR